MCHLRVHVRDLAVLGQWLDLMTLEVLSNFLILRENSIITTCNSNIADEFGPTAESFKV